MGTLLFWCTYYFFITIIGNMKPFHILVACCCVLRILYCLLFDVDFIYYLWWQKTSFTLCIFISRIHHSWMGWLYDEWKRTRSKYVHDIHNIPYRMGCIEEMYKMYIVYLMFVKWIAYKLSEKISLNSLNDLFFFFWFVIQKECFLDFLHRNVLYAVRISITTIW